jgi:WD40 repeat protein
MIASGSDDKTVRLWDIATGKEAQRLRCSSSICAIAFSLDSKSVAAGSKDKTVRLWDIATGEERQNHRTSRIVSRIVFPSDGGRLETDIGPVDISTAPNTHPTSVIEPQSTLLLEPPWIKFRGADFLWLPHEYRGKCYDASGSSLVIGQASGGISFLSFK